MSGRTKNRRRRFTREICLDPIALAIHRASKPPASDLDAVIAPVRQAFQAMREGVASELQWSVLASSVNVALAIEQQRVVAGLQAHLKAAERALQEIYRRSIASGAWRQSAMYWQEIDAIDEFVPLHRFQLQQLSRGEVIKAMDQAEAEIRSSGGTAIHVDQLPAQEQLALLGATS